MKLPEILAPAGSMETLRAALLSGADAVYAGGKKFSARSSAVNFSDDELAEAVRLCHKYGAKLYLAVNTVVADDEMENFCEYIKFTASVGVDAYIVQDWGCAEIIRKAVPDAVLHGSTQMSIHTAAGASMLGGLGFRRVVPARELDRAAIEKIVRTGIETEIFVHGALCMSVSGQCYMSAVIGSRSANRGCCGQACRLPFSAVGSRDSAALSLKDLSLIPKARELAEIGVDSLKIEGRMKRPEYVAAAVNELKKSLGEETPDMNLLKGIFSRGGFTDGYFTGNRSNMFGVREKEDVTAARTLIPKIHELYRFERKVFSADFHAVIRKDTPLSITAVCGDISAEVQDDPPEKAVSRPTDMEILRKQLSRLGDTVFTLGKITAELDEGLIVPAGRLNELRRRLTDALTEKIIEKYTPKFTVSDYVPKLSQVYSEQKADKLPLRTYCRTAEQAKSASSLSEYIIAPEDIINTELIGIVGTDRLIVSPPRFISDEELLISRLSKLKALGINRLLCHTPDCIAIGKKLGFRLHGSFSLNIFNSFSAEYMMSLGLEDCIVSFEAKASQINAMRTSLPLGAVVYGRLPLMLTRNCPIKNEIGCGRCTGHLIDRTGRTLPVACSKEYVEVLNSDCLFMLDKTDEFSNIAFGEVILYDEDSEQTTLVLTGYKPKNITHGLYYRGIHNEDHI